MPRSMPNIARRERRVVAFGEREKSERLVSDPWGVIEPHVLNKYEVIKYYIPVFRVSRKDDMAQPDAEKIPRARHRHCDDAHTELPHTRTTPVRQ